MALFFGLLRDKICIQRTKIRKKMISFTKFILLLFFAYLCNAIFVFYHLFMIEKCVSNCILPEYPITSYKNLKVSVYTSRSNNGRPSDMSLVWDSGDRLITQTFESDVNITLPFATRRNGSLYAYVFLHPADASPFHGVNSASAVQRHQLSEYAFPKDRAFNLIQGGHSAKPEQPITHVHSKMAVFIAEFEAPLNRYGIPAEIYTLLTINSNYKYLPILYVDQLSTLKRNLVPILSNTSEVKVQLSVKGVSIGRLRIWAALEQNMLKMKQFGFTDADLDDVKGIFTDTNMLLLTLTFVVALVHLLFDVLAFKNDVSFWKNKETMEGMSTRAVLWRCVSTTIIFMYLCTEKTSLLVLLPAGVGTIIEFWKVTKALKIRLDWSAGGKLPGIKFGEKSTSEKQTSEFDQQAMTYLSYGLYPLLACGAVYSLLYQPHKSWWSWIIGSLVNGVYAFGFLFMLPQLFVNYKLKSVAHLPWRAFMYKAFNTFIDDVFAFIIVMPTAHRLACFRDDVIFIIYLYQRWLYPVDKSRANEYGMKFEEDKTIEETKKEK